MRYFKCDCCGMTSDDVGQDFVHGKVYIEAGGIAGSLYFKNFEDYCIPCLRKAFAKCGIKFITGDVD